MQETRGPGQWRRNQKAGHQVKVLRIIVYIQNLISPEGSYIYLKFNITRRVKLATISWGWTYSEGNREKRGIRVHEECQAGTHPEPVELEGPEWVDGEKAREDPEAGQDSTRIEGRGEAKHVGPRAISQSPYAPWSRQILTTAGLGGEGYQGPRRWRAEV